jgi:hypothetical protein
MRTKIFWLSVIGTILVALGAHTVWTRGARLDRVALLIFETPSCARSWASLRGSERLGSASRLSCRRCQKERDDGRRRVRCCSAPANTKRITKARGRAGLAGVLGGFASRAISPRRRCSAWFRTSPRVAHRCSRTCPNVTVRIRPRASASAPHRGDPRRADATVITCPQPLWPAAARHRRWHHDAESRILALGSVTGFAAFPSRSWTPPLNSCQIESRGRQRVFPACGNDQRYD